MKIINKTAIIISSIVFLAAAACAGKTDYPSPPPYYPLPSGEFPIGATFAFYHPFINDQQFEWVKEAGFNYIVQNLSVEDLDSCLRLAKKYGLKVQAKPYTIRDTVNMNKGAGRYKDNPEVWGFGVFDEPKASQFPYLKRLVTRIGEVAPNQNSFINLLPAVSSKDLEAKDYEQYVEDYVRTVNPPFLSLDIYSVKEDKNGNIYVDECMYETMDVINRVARESGRPFWSYVLSNKHPLYPEPREEFIRFEAFSSLAYGAQGIRYYTYLIPDFDLTEGNYSFTPIDREGNRTATWYMVRNVNLEIKNLTDVFLGASLPEVTLTGNHIPKGATRNYRVPAPFRGLETQAEGVIVSHFRNGNNEYLLLVNRDVLNKQKIRLSRSRAVTRLLGDGSEKEEKGSTVTLAPGGYALYRL